MSREIKFRGRKNSTKEWIYGSLITDKTKGYAIIQITDNPISNGVVNGWCFGIEKGTECQYTGLKDKDGKEIYEGDLLHRHMGVYWEAAFVNSSWIGKSLIDSGVYLSASQFIETEIIGNIYENPELLP